MRASHGLLWWRINLETIHNRHLSLIIEKLSRVRQYHSGKPSSHVDQFDSLLNEQLIQYQKHDQELDCHLKRYQKASQQLNKSLVVHERRIQHPKRRLKQAHSPNQQPKQNLFISILPDFTAKEPPSRNRAMYAWIQFITTPTVDTPGTALLLHFDDKRYIIGNIHEGFQRACVQMGIRLMKASEIFITGKTEWKNTGGLMGLVLTLADITAATDTDRIRNNYRARDTKPTLTVHGGDNLAHSLATGRRFIFRQGMPVQVKEYPETDGRHKLERGWVPDWSDRHLQMWAMVIEPSSTENSTTSAESKYSGKRSFGDFAGGISPPENAKVTESRELSPRLGENDCADVVMDMFASNWQKDAFEEVPLAEVSMPANIFVRNKDTQAIERYTGPLPGVGSVSDIKVLTRKPWPVKLHLPPAKPSRSAISYIIRCQRQRGKFLAEKAKALNVPVGPLRSKLAGGSEIQLLDGTIIKPEMVLGESKNGGGVVVADLPSQDYVHGLLSRPEWKAPEVMTGVEAVIWILGSGVSQNEELQNFISDHKHLKHIMSSPDHCPNHLAFSSSALASSRLKQIDPLRYPILVHDNVTLPLTGQPGAEKNGASEVFLAERGLKLQLEPSVSIRKEHIVPPTDTGEGPELSENVRSIAERARQEILSEPMQTELNNQQLPSPDAEIICLGTGSATPSKYRNVAATLLRVPGAGSYLLDCGENTLGQLKRVFSPAELGEVLHDLKLIWISHLHADHHLGITSVIKAWYEEVHGKLSPAQKTSRDSTSQDIQDVTKALASERRLCIVSNPPMIDWLREYSSVENFGLDRLVPISSYAVSASARLGLKWDTQVINFEQSHSLLTDTLKSMTGLADIATCHVNHCRGAQAVSLTFPTGFKFSYSGDCRPSSRFAEIGKGSTVLLHEATFEDERQDDALAKKHSTISEAIAVGKKMGARRILLTHFSQRYSKIPVGLKEINVELGFDEDGEDLAGDTTQAQILDMDFSNNDRPGSRGIDAQPIPATPEPRFPLTDSPTVQPVSMESSPKGASVEELRVGVASDPTNIESESTRSQNGHSAAQTVAIHPTSGDASVDDLKVGMAFDYMKVKVKDIMLLEKYAPALLKLFEEAEAEEAEKKQVEVPEPGKGKKKARAQNATVESDNTRRSA
ncbi:hypothetical protein MMC07_005009 [Pseudocyphellaria aurata]|nr:hypothetical protein [Pseudocyphellaria aurata]